MKKIIRLTESDLARIIRRTINEMDMDSDANKSSEDVEMALNQILTNNEIEFLKNHFESEGKQGFKMDVTNAVKDVKGERELHEEDEMSDDEYKLRNIVNKIIKKGTALAGLGIIPAAMFSGGSAALALGITSLVGLLLKDSAFWRKDGGIHYKELRKSDKEVGNMTPNDY